MAETIETYELESGRESSFSYGLGFYFYRLLIEALLRAGGRWAP